MEADWRPVQGSNPPDGGSDWRAQLQPEARGRIVNKIMETLTKHHPLSEHGLDVLRGSAVLLEEKIYSIATNLADYLQKLSLKTLSMKKERQQAPGNAQVIPNQNNLGQAKKRRRITKADGVTPDGTKKSGKRPAGAKTAKKKGKAQEECTIPPTPVATIQHIGGLLGIAAEELTKEKLMANPKSMKTDAPSNDK